MNSDGLPFWKPNGDRLKKDIDTLATHVDPALPGWTRRPFTPSYREARSWLQGQMEEAGLVTRFDASANLIGKRHGSNADLAPIVIGSHIDTVIGGGRFDGVIGVLGGLEVARRLRETGTQLRHSLEIVDFTAEETTEFGVSAVGSRGMVGALTNAMLATSDSAGKTLGEAILAAGGRPDDIQAEVRKTGDIALYLELHIEQGPVLEREQRTLGVVTGIVGISRVRVSVAGQPGHAGTVPMSVRKDALTGAAEMILVLEALCRQRQRFGVVGTVGWLAIEPNAANVVPGRVAFLAEVRATETRLIEDTLAEFTSRVSRLAFERELVVNIEPVTYSKPVQINPEVTRIIEDACDATAPPARLLPSGAGHDANQMDRIAPVGMLFVTSRDGLSHCPEEWSEIDHITSGVEALSRSVLALDSSWE